MNVIYTLNMHALLFSEFTIYVDVYIHYICRCVCVCAHLFTFSDVLQCNRSVTAV